MNLRLEIINIRNIQFGESTMIKDGILSINREELIKVLEDKESFKSVDIDLARPGESIRIIPVKDVLEPRIKVEDGGFFPGFIGNFSSCGKGCTKVLRGCGVVTTGSIVGFQEGLIDMTGPGAKHSHYSKLNNVVVLAEPVEGITQPKHEEAIRLAGVKAAHYLAQAALNIDADETEVYELNKVPVDKKLPRIAYVHLLLAQGLLHDNFLYGVDAKRIHPTILHPNEFMDGAVVSGNCVTASDKNTTYDHENNPVIADLYARHNKELDFARVIVSPVCPGLKDKERCAASVVNLAMQMGVDGIIIAEEGGGNPEADVMAICKQAEQAGIKTVLMLQENGGPDGTGEPLTINEPLADAVISIGNTNELITLPHLGRVIGHLETIKLLAGSTKQPIKNDGTVETSFSVIMGAMSDIGITKVTAIDY